MRYYISLIFLLLLSCPAFAMQVLVPMYSITPSTHGLYAGYVVLAASPQGGMIITPHLSKLTAGFHGMHVHQNPACQDSGNAAGGHYDPHQTGKHRGPYNKTGHQGDLPAIRANMLGVADTPVYAPNTTMQQTLGHSIIIHAGGDNYTDTPSMGGAGKREICGVVSLKNTTVKTTLFNPQ